MADTSDIPEMIARAMLADLGYPAALDLADPYKRIVTIQMSSADFMGMARVAAGVLAERARTNLNAGEEARELRAAEKLMAAAITSAEKASLDEAARYHDAEYNIVSRRIQSLGTSTPREQEAMRVHSFAAAHFRTLATKGDQ